MMRIFVLAALTLATLSTLSRPALASDGYSLRWLPGSVEAAASETPAALAAFDDLDASDTAGISAGRAALYSLLLPGLGDYKSGNRSRGYVFFGIEAAIWTTFIVSRIQGQQREDSYEEWAVLFGSVESTGHSDDFYVLIREYDNSVQYEADIKQEGREALWPDVAYEPLEDYFVRNRVSDYEEWEWVSLDAKIQFQEIRSASKNAYRLSSFALAAAVANRLVSAVFAYTSVRHSETDNAEQARRYHIDFTPPRSDYEAAVTVSRRF
jgi:hypothetical protein